MNYAVIDIGTNTIRSVIYDMNYEMLDEIVAESCILEHMSGGTLTECGISILCESLERALEFFGRYEFDRIFCFATSAMRDVKNFDVVNKTVMTRCGFEIELISEDEEAMCDYASLKMQIGENCFGAGIDLGGGSCQVMMFEAGKLKYHYSEKLGVKRLYKLFGELTPENENEVREYIIEKFEAMKKIDSEYIYVMGGSSKIIKKSVKTVLKTETITRKSINDILDLYYKKAPVYKLLTGTEYYKIPYGILVIDELCGYLSSEKISVMSGGVREGYIKRKTNN